MKFQPGDLVMTFDPGNEGPICWGEDNLYPGMVGIVVSGEYVIPPGPGRMVWCNVVDVRFDAFTSPCAVLLLKKLRPPPQEDEEFEREMNKSIKERA